jgi:Tol biopolymer transport system component
MEVLRSIDFYMKPAWDKDNNVIFSSSGSMMKYNMNTNIIEPVSFNNIPGDVFSIDGSKLIFQELGVQSLVLDLLSGNITTSNVVSENPTASPNQSHIAYFDLEKYAIFILNTNTNIAVDLFKPDYQPLSFAWGSEQELYWASYSGLFKINIETRQVERIKKHCGTNTKVKYINPFFDVNGKFYVTKEVGTQVGLIDADLKGEIIEYDLNTCTEIKIFD